MTGLLPLPGSLAELISQGSAPGLNLSLVFDRGFDGYESGWRLEAGSKADFLRRFRNGFAEPPDFQAAIARRQAALDALGAVSHTLITQTPLVVGLGLAHPTETGFLFDRLTGAPYLPASSIKGLLREAAGLIARGALETSGDDDDSFWKQHRDRLFGPDRTAAVPAAGELVVYDAFPERWPELAVDTLTPHHGSYYGADDDSRPPGDWDEPVPVAFLTVAPNSAYRFSFGHRKKQRREDDLEAVLRLLPVALDWLGIGGKTSSGYGVFGSGQTPVAQPVPQVSPSRTSGQTTPSSQRTAPPGPEGKRKEPIVVTTTATTWEGTTLELDRGTPTLRRGKRVATCTKRQLDRFVPGLTKRLKKAKTLTVDAEVSKYTGQNAHNIVAILKVYD